MAGSGIGGKRNSGAEPERSESWEGSTSRSDVVTDHTPRELEKRRTHVGAFEARDGWACKTPCANRIEAKSRSQPRAEDVLFRSTYPLPRRGKIDTHKLP